MTEAPKRRYTMTIEIGADDYDAMLSALDNWILEMRLNYPDLSDNHSGVSGGSDSGYSYSILVDQDMTHDKYFDLVRTYLDNRKTDGEGEEYDEVEEIRAGNNQRLNSIFDGEGE